MLALCGKNSGMVCLHVDFGDARDLLEHSLQVSDVMHSRDGELHACFQRLAFRKEKILLNASELCEPC